MLFRSYDERQPLEPQCPSVRPSVADFIADMDQSSNGHQRIQNDFHEDSREKEDVELRHAPPGPAYDGLVNNISLAMQELKGYPWKEGTGDFAGVRDIGKYIQGFARTFYVEPLVKYSTRVEKLEKIGEKWRLSSTTLVRCGPGSPTKKHEHDVSLTFNLLWVLTEFRQIFSAVVVASGHYHACRVPDIPGLTEWKAAWPDRVQHSKGYRKPDGFKDQVRYIGFRSKVDSYSGSLMHHLECSLGRSRSIFNGYRSGNHLLCQENISIITRKNL